VLSSLDGSGSINELEMLSECMTEQCLSEEEFSYLSENLPSEFAELGILFLSYMQLLMHEDTCMNLRVSLSSVPLMRFGSVDSVHHLMHLPHVAHD
jgi:hypothetical protein